MRCGASVSRTGDDVFERVASGEPQLGDAIELAQHVVKRNRFQAYVGWHRQHRVYGDQGVAPTNLDAVPGEEHRPQLRPGGRARHLAHCASRTSSSFRSLRRITVSQLSWLLKACASASVSFTGFASRPILQWALPITRATRFYSAAAGVILTKVRKARQPNE